MSKSKYLIPAQSVLIQGGCHRYLDVEECTPGTPVWFMNISSSIQCRHLWKRRVWILWTFLPRRGGPRDFNRPNAEAFRLDDGLEGVLELTTNLYTPSNNGEQQSYLHDNGWGGDESVNLFLSDPKGNPHHFLTSTKFSQVLNKSTDQFFLKLNKVVLLATSDGRNI